MRAFAACVAGCAETWRVIEFFTLAGEGADWAAQIFRTKDIDQLISDSQEPEKRLKKTLGALSLTSLGIGAVIGSGIFTVIGTAIAGQKMQFSSILNAPTA